MVIEMRNVEKAYEQGQPKTYVLRRVSTDVREGEVVSIMGQRDYGTLQAAQ